jgi:hypothetical protein
MMDALSGITYPASLRASKYVLIFLNFDPRITVDPILAIGFSQLRHDPIDRKWI